MNTPTLSRGVVNELETRVVIEVCRVWPRGRGVQFTARRNFLGGVKYLGRAKQRRFV
jgi:hypothetical protein